MRAAIYARVSTTDQAEEGTSISTQLQQCRAYVTAKGWRATHEYLDEGVSGAADRRPALDRLMAACHAGQVDAVVVAKLDRFSRSQRHLVTAFTDLDRLGVAFVSVSESFDSSTPVGRMLRSLLGTFAEFERDRITERMVDGLRAVTSRGYWPGGPAPYGYRIVAADDGTKHKRLEIEPEEADVLRLVIDLILNNGQSTYSAAATLNEMGIRTRRGALWRHPNLCHQLRRPHLTGKWTYNQGKTPIEVDIPAILSPAEWTQLQATIKGTPRPQRKQRLYPLSGRGRVHVRCQCGSNFSGVTRVERKRRAYYTCSSAHHSFGEQRCPHLPRTYQAIPLEEAVWREVVNVLTDPKLLRELAALHLASTSETESDQQARRDLETAVDRLKTQQRRLARRLAEDDALDLLSDALADIDDELRPLEERLARIANTEGLRRLDPQRLDELADTAKQRLTAPTPELAAALYELLDLQLQRTSSDRFEGTATIPLPDDGQAWADLLPLADGDVQTKAPRRP